MTIQRWDVIVKDGMGTSLGEASKVDDGLWVFHGDHVAALAAKDARIAELEAALRGVVDACDREHGCWCDRCRAEIVATTQMAAKAMGGSDD